MAQQRNLVDVGDLFFQFKEEGDAIAGRYLGSQPIRWQDGSMGESHYIDTGEGVYNFNGTYQLNNRLPMVEPGGYIEIRFAGISPTNRGLSPVKLFEIKTDSPRPLPAAANQPGLPGMGNPAPGQPPVNTRPLVMGGMPAHEVGNAAALRAVQGQQQGNVVYGQGDPAAAPHPADVQGQVPLRYLPDGTPIFGFAPDGSPLDAYGRLIPQGMQG